VMNCKKREDNSTIHATKALEEELHVRLAVEYKCVSHVTALLIEEAENAFKATKAYLIRKVVKRARKGSDGLQWRKGITLNFTTCGDG
jgi:hypothetical protein